MPGLIRGAARVAVVAGTATAVSNRVSRRQANKWSQQDEAAAYEAQQQQAQYAPPPQQYAAPPPPPQYAAPAPAPAAPASDPMVDQLTELAKLKDAGILTEEEFAAKKAQILGI